jgi:hypothetical protein
MKDTKEIRQELWRSLDMVWVRLNAVLILAIFAGLGLWFGWIGYRNGDWDTFALIMVFVTLVLVPFLGSLSWRTYRIFRAPASYTFCRCCLSSPKGGSIRDSIKFTVVIEDADGYKFAADTHAIFQARRGAGLVLEDYVNKTVTVAYNEETGSVVVIG